MRPCGVDCIGRSFVGVYDEMTSLARRFGQKEPRCARCSSLLLGRQHAGVDGGTLHFSRHDIRMVGRSCGRSVLRDTESASTRRQGKTAGIMRRTGCLCPGLNEGLPAMGASAAGLERSPGGTCRIAMATTRHAWGLRGKYEGSPGRSSLPNMASMACTIQLLTDINGCAVDARTSYVGTGPGMCTSTTLKYGFMEVYVDCRKRRPAAEPVAVVVVVVRAEA